MKSAILTLVVCGLWIGTSCAWGQAPPWRNPEIAPEIGSEGTDGTPHYVLRRDNNGTPVMYWHASTIQQGVLDGRANFLRGIGDMNYSNSLAAINFQVARNYAYQNAREHVQTYYDRKYIADQAKAYFAPPRRTLEDWTRLAREAMPKPLTEEEYDASVGTLYWPPVLQNAMFADDRTQIDILFAQRRHRPVDSGLGTENYRLLREAAEDLKLKLAAHIDDFTPREYLAALNFVRGIELEAMNRASNVHYSRLPSN